jgi:hypothetical protein
MQRKPTSPSLLLFGVPLVLAAQGCWMMAGIGGPGGGSDTDSDSDTDSQTDSQTETEPCDEQSIPVYEDPVRVLILMDHSSSMAGGNWEIARDAVAGLLAAFADTSLQFGLDTVPEPGGANCAVSESIPVDCGPGTEAEIGATLAGMSTYVSTPLYCGLRAFADPGYAPGCTAGEYDKYILLIADGEDSCGKTCVGGGGATTSDFAEVTELLVGLGIKVIVVGFNVVMSSEQLNAIAANGGTEFTTYLDAGDGASLDAALDTIATSIDGCVFTIGSSAASAEPELVNFYFDGEVLPMDADCSSGAGWRWASSENTQVELCPDSCAALASGAVDELTGTFGCETIVD